MRQVCIWLGTKLDLGESVSLCSLCWSGGWHLIDTNSVDIFVTCPQPLYKLLSANRCCLSTLRPASSWLMSSSFWVIPFQLDKPPTTLLPIIKIDFGGEYNYYTVPFHSLFLFRRRKFWTATSSTNFFSSLFKVALNCASSLSCVMYFFLVLEVSVTNAFLVSRFFFRQFLHVNIFRIYFLVFVVVAPFLLY